MEDREKIIEESYDHPIYTDRISEKEVFLGGLKKHIIESIYDITPDASIDLSVISSIQFHPKDEKYTDVDEIWIILKYTEERLFVEVPSKQFYNDLRLAWKEFKYYTDNK